MKPQTVTKFTWKCPWSVSVFFVLSLCIRDLRAWADSEHFHQDAFQNKSLYRLNNVKSAK